MNRTDKGLSLLILMITLSGCYKEIPLVGDQSEDGIVRILSFDRIEGMVDAEDRNIFFTLPSDTLESFSPNVDFHGYTSLYIDNKELVKGEENYLGLVVTNHPYQIIAENKNLTDTFNLIFTSLPLIHIMTDEEIIDEPKVLSRMVMQFCDPLSGSPTVQSFESFAGIEIRGGSSMKYNKKSFGLELWKDKSGRDYSASLLGMRFVEDWILDAMYIDKLRMRNKISFELWKKMSRPPHEDHRDQVFPGIECRLVELVINNKYHGIYSLNEKLDPNLLQYTGDQYKEGGVLYKAIQWSDGATLFETYSSLPPNEYYWDGWEQVYPEHFISWDALADLRKLIVTAEDSVFERKIGSLIDLDNAVNYYLFINVLKAYDNAGKNTFLARYTGQSRFFIIPWDIDGSWGIWWDGILSLPSGRVENQLFIRLRKTDAGDFNEQVESTWDLYRSTIFHPDSLLLPITQYHHMMIMSGAIERENKRWENISIDLDLEFEYIATWLEERLHFLDKEFDD